MNKWTPDVETHQEVKINPGEIDIGFGLTLKPFNVRIVRAELTNLPPAPKGYPKYSFTFVAEVTNVSTGLTGEVGGRYTIEEGDPEYLAHSIRTRLITALIHEIDECLFLNGEPLVLAHPERSKHAILGEPATQTP